MQKKLKMHKMAEYMHGLCINMCYR